MRLSGKHIALLGAVLIVVAACRGAEPGAGDGTTGETGGTPADDLPGAGTAAMPTTAAPGDTSPAAPAEMPKISDKAVTTDSGLQYEDLAVGEGDDAKVDSLVSVHYTGWLQDGTIFDSSRQRDQPVQFTCGARLVIPGWEEGVLGMKPGGKRILVVPPDLGYGANGFPPVIPPNASLVFEIELESVGAAPEVPAQPADAGELTTTDTGLQYAIVQPGDGPIAEAGDRVTVHYTGWLEDGTMFDSSLRRGAPIDFVLGQGRVIAGWDEGVAGMQVGEKRQLRIPSDLGYGAAGSAPAIPPNATLIFDVELLGVQ